MGLLETMLAGVDRRAGTSGVSRPSSWFLDLLGGGYETYSGKTVTPESALSLVPVYSAVSLLAGSVGMLPLIVYRRLDQGRERASNHRTWTMLHEQPNEFMAADEFWELLTAHLLLWGNGYAAKGRGDDGLVRELVPLNPKSVQVGWDKRGRPFYVYTTPEGKTVGPVGPEDVLHFRGLGTTGRMGLSPIQQARQMLANSLAREEFEGRLWRNSARPAGVLRHPGELSEKAQKRLRVSWENVQGGLANAGKTAILEEGMEWQALGLPLVDAQFIEQQQFGRSDVALLFRVPPSKLAADTGGSMTYSNVESEGIDFVRWSLGRWTKRHEGTLKRDPDLFLQGSRFYPEFLYDALLRGDSQSRATFYGKALDPVKGWLTVDEVRELENRNPLSEEQRAERERLAKIAKPSKTQGENDDGEPDGSQGGDE